MNLTHTVGLMELVWTVCSLFAVTFGLRALLRAIVDLRILRAAGKNHLRSYVAISSIISFTVWTFVPLIYLYFGIWSMTLPQLADTLSARQWANLSLFIFASVLLAIGAILIDHRRVKIIRMIEEGESNE